MSRRSRFGVLAVLAPLLGVLAPLLAGCGTATMNEGLAANAVNVDETEAQAMISAYRRAHGLRPVTFDAVLEGAAANQALAMARAGRLSHTLAGSLAERLDAAHVRGAAAENVSAGYGSLAEALAGWRKSPPHDANLLNPNVTRMGIASAYAPESRYHQYWSLILAD